MLERPEKHFPSNMEVKKRNLDKRARIWPKSSTSTVQKLAQATHLKDNLIMEGDSRCLYLCQPLCIRQARPFLSGPSLYVHIPRSVEGKGIDSFNLSLTHTPPWETNPWVNVLCAGGGMTTGEVAGVAGAGGLTMS